MTGVVVAAALIAGAGGALLRYGFTWAYRASPARLPMAVLIVNVLGSVLAGVLTAAGAGDPTGAFQLIAVSGFAGGLSTFSTFSVETVQLALAGRWRTALGSVALNVVGGVAGYAIALFATTFFLVMTTWGPPAG